MSTPWKEKEVKNKSRLAEGNAQPPVYKTILDWKAQIVLPSEPEKLPQKHSHFVLPLVIIASISRCQQRHLTFLYPLLFSLAELFLSFSVNISLMYSPFSG